MFSKSKSFHKPCPPNEHYLKEPSLRIGSHLLKKSLMANFFFCRVRYILFHTLNIIKYYYLIQTLICLCRQRWRKRKGLKHIIKYNTCSHEMVFSGTQLF